MTARSDTGKGKTTTRGGHKYIDIELGYDDSDYTKKIHVRLQLSAYAYPDKIVLFVDNELVKLINSPYAKRVHAKSVSISQLKKGNERLCLSAKRALNKCFECQEYKTCESRKEVKS
jgi:hypothetical protein